MQSKQESDVFMGPEKKKSDSPVPPAPQRSVNDTVTTTSDITKRNDKKTEFSSRLGPPQALKFPTPVSATARECKAFKFPAPISTATRKFNY